ncbi:hypothetical protein ANACOL_01755 [Anaerotruncus colihominis DSM 17241]|uniref:Uncharacterized protein n=1 Tax=Anaerotruncus colihominis DSM 17241 TaxID=445972 RepID=B0PAF6_9FIRM|nr:hypothetical protein ANACOL_01755 [Anaerotruncus colihominis DSM 17241]
MTASPSDVRPKRRRTDYGPKKALFVSYPVCTTHEGPHLSTYPPGRPIHFAAGT